MLERVDTDWDCWCCFTGSENITTGYMLGMVCWPAFPKLVARNKQMPSKMLLMVVLILTSGSSRMWVVS